MAGMGVRILRSYGDRFALICEICASHLQMGRSWSSVQMKPGRPSPAPVLASDIYDGETYDSRMENLEHSTEDIFGVKLIEIDKNKLEARRSLPVCINEELKPVAVIQTPAGETVLDMGQNMVGWIRFRTQRPFRDEDPPPVWRSAAGR